jgi:hypothetical protein
MLVRQQDDTVNTAVTFAPLPVVDAHSLVHTKMGKAIRAVYAADIADGFAQISNIPVWVLALLLRVSVTYIVAARRLDQFERQRVRCGMRPLIPSRPKPAHVPAPVMIEVDVKTRFLALVNEVGGVDAALNLLASEGVQIAA